MMVNPSPEKENIIKNIINLKKKKEKRTKSHCN